MDRKRERNSVIIQPHNLRIIQFDRDNTHWVGSCGNIDYFNVTVYHFYLPIPLKLKSKTKNRIYEVQVTDVEDDNSDESESNHESEYTINSLVLTYVTEEKRYVLHNRRHGMLCKHRERKFEVIISNLEDILVGGLVPVFDLTYPQFPKPLSRRMYIVCLYSYPDIDHHPRRRTIWSKADLSEEIVKYIRALKYMKCGYYISDSVDDLFKDHMSEVKEWKDKCGRLY